MSILGSTAQVCKRGCRSNNYWHPCDWFLICKSRSTGSGTVGTSALTSAVSSSRDSSLVKTIRLRVALVSGVLLSILIIWLYAHTTWKLFEDWWTRDEASYGMLIPPIAAYIAYARRRSTFGIPATLDARGLLGIAAACLLFLVGKLG